MEQVCMAEKCTSARQSVATRSNILKSCFFETGLDLMIFLPGEGLVMVSFGEDDKGDLPKD
jgi:hypothetical protein